MGHEQGGSVGDSLRLLFVVPRFGGATVGGAERLVGELASRGVPGGWRAEIATTCASNHYTWANELPAGESKEDGLVVRRFEVGPRDSARYDQLHAEILSGKADYATELEWLANSVWSPALQEFLEREVENYDLTLFAPYFFGTTIWGAQVAPKRSALVPCLHDEAYARLQTIRRVLGSVRGCVFNSEAEERLARGLSEVRQSGIVGLGFDPPQGPPAAHFAEPRGIGRYLLYAGRIEEGKRVNVAVEHAMRHAEESPDAPKLVLIGSGTYEPPDDAEGVVVSAGFLDEDERRAAYAEAVALVNPSELESFSIVLMEAWLEGTPALVASGSDVMREHVERSGGGLTFASYEEYRVAVDALLADEGRRQTLGQAGRTYVLEQYSWPAVRQRFRDTVELLAA
jgi:glycosyltransferase involved in cell wall biosynthesis